MFAFRLDRAGFGSSGCGVVQIANLGVSADGRLMGWEVDGVLESGSSAAESGAGQSAVRGMNGRSGCPVVVETSMVRNLVRGAVFGPDARCPQG